MMPQFFDQLNLRNNSRTVAAGGPCNWEDDDVSAVISEVKITQGSVVGSSSGSITVQRSKTNEWWLEASSSSQFTRGPALAQAVAVVRKTSGTDEPRYLWPDPPPPSNVQLH
jgi:hypothetical protein